MINQENVSLVTTANSVKFVSTLNLDNLLLHCQLQSKEFVSKFPVYIKYDTVIPKQSTTYVEVYLECNHDVENEHTFLTRPVFVEIGNISYHIPIALVNSKCCYLQINNVGTENITWVANKLIARADIATEVNDDGVNVFRVGQHSVAGTFNIELCDIDVGDLNESESNQLLELMNRYSHTFAKDTNDLGCTDLLKMHINTTLDDPVFYKPYRLSYKERNSKRKN